MSTRVGITKNDRMLKSYLKKIFDIANRGDAREESYYSILEGLLKEYIESVGKKNIHITTLPKKTEAGNPDFRIWDGKQHIVGYIEAKAPTVADLDQIEDTEQLKRYLHTFPNLILTNFFEFRLYRNGNLIDKVLIGRPFVVHKLKTTPPVEKESDFLKLFEKFFSFSLPKVYDAKNLATELAKRTRFLKEEVVAQELKTVGQTFLSDHNKQQTDHNKQQTGMSVLHGFYEAFRQYLISGLSKEDFADLYSQTVTYGLFAARTRSENSFNRKLAYDNIPRTIGILRDVFKFISLEDLPQQMEWIIDDISEVLAVTDVKNILHQYFHEGKGKDPVVHFYETFLAEYDPKTREKRGVYYTPEPVVSYIVRSLQNILKEHFNRADGFASDTVTVLDPAAGTLTFLAEASKLAVEEFVPKYGEGGKENFIKEHILKNFYAFELMMAPYAVGHLKMSFLLEELGYKLQKDDRFKLYLTNTLEMEELAQTELPGMASLSEESHLAGEIKKEQPILVILGNPPYSGISANMGDWITGLIEDYKYVDGKHFGERKHWLQDDYVKFIRFAQWKIEQAGEGILGFITNHSYLDNPTFRGMRQSLMNSFDEIYVLDLHGNSLKKEKCPDGSKDENVFDIQQGVAVALFIKKNVNVGQTFLSDNNRDRTDRTDRNVCSTDYRCNIYHAEIWGLREKKYDWLLENDLKRTKWEKLTPTSPYYFFVSREEKGREVYEKYWKIMDIFSVKSVGVVTGRDSLTIKWDKEEVWNTVVNFSKMGIELARQSYNLGKDSRDWKVRTAQKDIIESGLDKNRLIKILYRPFDIRFTYYTGNSRGFYSSPQHNIMHHMLQENLALCVGRAGQVVGLKKPWNIVFCSEYIEDFNLFYRGGNVNFPLYLYPGTDKKGLFSETDKGTGRNACPTDHAFQFNTGSRQPNINPKLFECLSKIYTKQVGQTFLSDISDKDIGQGTDRNVCSTGADDEGLIIKRRKLPHWTLGGATYFVTFRTLQRELSVDEQKIVLEHIKEGEGRFYELIAEVVMPDHTHILFSPLKGYSLSRIMKGVKGVSAHKINQLRGTKGNVWQDESYDRIIRDQKELDEKLNYMLNNPLKKGLTDDPWNYHGWYFNEKYNETVNQTFLSDNNKQVDQTRMSELPDHVDKQECLSYQIFCYIYAILYSNIYRTKYAEFLKIDFPRIPFTKDYNLFSKMDEYGKKLVDLHLLNSSELDPPIAKFQGKGDNRIEKPQYSEGQNRVYINKDQYFEGIAKEVWQYQIGGYQVCDKWLKDRKGRNLPLDGIKHYCNIVTALQKTIEMQKEIDNIYPDVEKETIEAKNEQSV